MSVPTIVPGQDAHETSAEFVRREYEEQERLLHSQPPVVQRFLEAQARPLAEAIHDRLPQVRFVLPDRVVIVDSSRPDDGSKGTEHIARVPPGMRQQLVGGLLDRLTRTDLGTAVRQRLGELEQSSNRATAVAAALLRHATARYLVHDMLPAGRSVRYIPVDGEEIPTIPLAEIDQPESAITAPTDAIVEEGTDVEGRGELLVPFVPAARHFYLPQWVIFDDQGQLLVHSVNEAEAHLGSMQRFLNVLHAAVALAPYMVADEDYQRKRYGMLGQLVNQGRKLARYETEEIIRGVQQRAAAKDLNRGLSLSLPYFDDQTLQMRLYEFVVIPAGRIMFVPAFVVRAAREEQAKVVQDTRLSPSTRKYLLQELQLLENAFLSSRAAERKS